jgi:glycerol-3-phosphate dehydrogenase
MSRIDCDKDNAAGRHFELLVVGGGIQGAMLALEASLRGISTLLLEQEDFGAATSFNSLRIIHGGFRYTQHFDFQRMIASARERQWFLRFFPEFAAPLACLMPLYGRGLRRPILLGSALKMYQLLTERFNQELAPAKKIPAGRIITSGETAGICSWITREGLKGGAVWHDGFMPDSHRILIGALRWACDHGAAAINYCRAEELLTHRGRVVGVRAIDQSSGTCCEFRADVVINAAGPWCRQVAARFDRDVSRLFNTMVAWNVLFNRPAISSYAMAVSPPYAGAHTYFVVPWKGSIFVGTGQTPWTASRSEVLVREDDLDRFCGDLNLALPSLELKRDEIVHVYSGLQSAKRPGSSDFSHQDVFVDHSQFSGPIGFYSISGIKFTTARLLAEKTLNRVFPQRKHAFTGGQTSFYDPPSDIAETHMLFDDGWGPAADSNAWAKSLRPLITQEAVQHLDDLVVRRSNLGNNPERAGEMANALSELFDWGEVKRKAEIDRLKDHFPFYTNGAKRE